MSNTKSEDMLKSRAWAEHFFSNAADLPISFVFDGQAMSGIPEAWQPASSRRRIDSNISESENSAGFSLTVFEGTDTRTGLNVRVELTEYEDYPVMEWVAWFTNRGRNTTPLIRDIVALDGTFTGSLPILHHCNGDFGRAEGYTPQETPLRAGDLIGFAPNRGRPCDGAFPYYRVMLEGSGLAIAIGWPGQWAASFSGLAEGVQVRAGQERTNLRLLPGESIRTPRMTVLSWSGDVSRGVNLWRRWYLAHILPRPNGQPLQPLLTCTAPDEGEEYTAATEENQIRYIDRFQQRGICPDVWWIDAGWYPCYNKDRERKWWLTGTWEPDPERFPNGLQPVSDHAARYGADLLLWFEPERVQPETRLAVEHPEWLLGPVGSDGSLPGIIERAAPASPANLYFNPLLLRPVDIDISPFSPPKPEQNSHRHVSLLNLGNPECRQWLMDHLCRLIQDNGVSIYRQDHNVPPLERCCRNEAEDRQGLGENLYVQGYLQLWDDLLARNPGLWIDSCAGGGRRNDLETLRRSVPLHYSDYGYGDNPVKLAFHHTLYAWIPYFAERTLSWDAGGKARFDHCVDSYSYHCGMAPMLFATLDIRRDDYDYALAKRMIDIWRRASGLILNGDYYPHTPFHRSAQQWVAWQFDCPETGRGLVQGIRLPACPEETLTIHPQGIYPDATHSFENAETGETRDIPGRDLIDDGFTFALPARSGAIWFYRRPDSPIPI